MRTLSELIDDEIQRRNDVEFEEEIECDTCGELYWIEDLNVVEDKFGNVKHYCDLCNVPF